MEPDAENPIALEMLMELLDNKQFTVAEARTLIRTAQEQRSRLLREVCDLRIRLHKYEKSHAALMEAVSDIVGKNTELRKLHGKD